MVRLLQEQRNEAVQMLLRGTSQAVLARNFQVSRSTITRLYQRLRQTGTTNDRPRSGRPRVTSRRQDRYMRLTHLRNRFRTAVETALVKPETHNNRISPDTVKNPLREFGLRPRWSYVGVHLTPQRRQVKLNWLTQHRPNLFPLRQWRNVMFSDESRFLLYRADGRRPVYRRDGERSRDNCVDEVDRFGGGGLMVWAGRAYGHRTPMVFIDGSLTAQRYVDLILQPVVVPFIRQHNVTFQQDNDRAHVARLSIAFLQQNNVDVLRWPPYSPDLSPIEHLWDILDSCVRRLPQQPTMLLAPREALIQDWNAIPQAQIDRLILSITRRVRAGLNANGGHTRYKLLTFLNL